MEKTLQSAIAALIASVVFSSTALAEGDYYEGLSKDQKQVIVDQFSTGSIDRAETRKSSEPARTSRDNRRIGEE
jgi:hypothetical protein